MSEHIVVSADRSGLELDEFLCLRFPDLSKRFVRRVVRRGAVLVDGAATRPSQRLRTDQVVSITLDDSEDVPTVPTAPVVGLVVAYEDDDALVVDKPAALTVEGDRWDPSRPSLSGALMAWAAARQPDAGGEGAAFRPRLVHRIDKDTSGAVLVAKHLDSERRLSSAFQSGGVEKGYLVLVEGEHPLADGDEELLDAPIGPDSRRSGRQKVCEGGKRAETVIAIEQRFQGYTLLYCRPRTGRTHQIRVHLSAAGFPLAVDPVYGRRDALFLSELKPGYRPKPGRAERPLIGRLTLHARDLSFPSGPGGPGGDREGSARPRVEVSVPPPADFRRALHQMAKVRPFRR